MGSLSLFLSGRNPGDSIALPTGVYMSSCCSTTCQLYSEYCRSYTYALPHLLPFPRYHRCCDKRTINSRGGYSGESTQPPPVSASAIYRLLNNLPRIGPHRPTYLYSSYFRFIYFRLILSRRVSPAHPPCVLPACVCVYIRPCIPPSPSGLPSSSYPARVCSVGGFGRGRGWRCDAVFPDAAVKEPATHLHTADVYTRGSGRVTDVTKLNSPVIIIAMDKRNLWLLNEFDHCSLAVFGRYRYARLPNEVKNFTRERLPMSSGRSEVSPLFSNFRDS